MKRQVLPRSTVPRRKPQTMLPRPARRPPARRSSRRQVARIVEASDASLLDVLDSLLNKGVVLNADLVLALANVDLVYIRLSALLCAADRLGFGGDDGDSQA